MFGVTVRGNKLTDAANGMLLDAANATRSITSLHLTPPIPNSNSLLELKHCVERNVQRRECWMQAAVLTGFTRANQHHPFVNSIQPLIPTILQMVAPIGGLPTFSRKTLERYATTAHFTSSIR